MTHYRNVYEFDNGNQSLGACWPTREKAMSAIITNRCPNAPRRRVRRVGLLVVKEKSYEPQAM